MARLERSTATGMSDFLRSLAYPFAMVFVVGTTWAFAWARSVGDAADRRYWPAKDPALMERVLRAPAEGLLDVDRPDHAPETPKG